MQSLRRSGFFMKNRLSSALKLYNGLGSFLEDMPSKRVSEMGFAPFTSRAMGTTTINGLTKGEMINSGVVRKYVTHVNYTAKVVDETGGLSERFKERWSRQHLATFKSPFQPAQVIGFNSNMPCSARAFASKASESTRQKQSQQAQKEVSTVEDPFDAPTYNIPEKPVTFTEGASYSLIILLGLGIAAAAAYAVFKELIFEPKEYKIFGKALERIQNDGQVRVRIGAPITGYGSESRNRAARQRIPNRTWTDEDGVEHVEVNFYIRGPHGAGKVYTEMFKDKVDKNWKFTYLVVDIKSPSPAQLMLESYVPA